MALNRRFIYFVLFVAGVTAMFAGALGFVVVADKEYTMAFDRVEENNPASGQTGEKDVGAYGSLSEEQRRDFERAVDGETLRYESEDEVWPEIIHKDGRYYVFTASGSFDWLDPKTSGSVVAALLGAAVTVQSARWEHRLY